MIIITGSLIARAETLDELLRACVAHSRRSRTEDGCISHAVHVDAEMPLRLVFLECWRDRAAVAKHFADADARAFVKRARALAEASSRIEIYDGLALPLDALTSG